MGKQHLHFALKLLVLGSKNNNDTLINWIKTERVDVLTLKCLESTRSYIVHQTVYNSSNQHIKLYMQIERLWGGDKNKSEVESIFK